MLRNCYNREHGLFSEAPEKLSVMPCIWQLPIDSPNANGKSDRKSMSSEEYRGWGKGMGGRVSSQAFGAPFDRSISSYVYKRPFYRRYLVGARSASHRFCLLDRSRDRTRGITTESIADEARDTGVADVTKGWHKCRQITGYPKITIPETNLESRQVSFIEGKNASFGQCIDRALRQRAHTPFDGGDTGGTRFGEGEEADEVEEWTAQTSVRCQPLEDDGDQGAGFIARPAIDESRLAAGDLPANGRRTVESTRRVDRGVKSSLAQPLGKRISFQQRHRMSLSLGARLLAIPVLAKTAWRQKKMLLIDLLEELREALGLADLDIDEQGICSLICEGGAFAVQLSFRTNQVELDSLLGQIPGSEPPRLQVLEALLEANHQFQGTLGATLAVVPATGMVWLHQILQRPMGASGSFSQQVTHFIQAAKLWRDRLHTGSWQKPHPSEPELTDLEKSHHKI